MEMQPLHEAEKLALKRLKYSDKASFATSYEQCLQVCLSALVLLLPLRQETFSI